MLIERERDIYRENGNNQQQKTSKGCSYMLYGMWNIPDIKIKIIEMNAIEVNFQYKWVFIFIIRLSFNKHLKLIGGKSRYIWIVSLLLVGPILHTNCPTSLTCHPFCEIIERFNSTFGSHTMWINLLAKWKTWHNETFWCD